MVSNGFSAGNKIDIAFLNPTGLTTSYAANISLLTTTPMSGGLVDPLYYDVHNPDVFAAGLDAAAGLNPLQHFHDSGWREGRDPCAAFSVRDYLAANADVKAAGLDPLAHWLASGRA